MKATVFNYEKNMFGSSVFALVCSALLCCAFAFSFIGCENPAGNPIGGGNPVGGNGAGLNITISRAANSTPGQFTYTVTNPPSGVTGYETKKSGTKLTTTVSGNNVHVSSSDLPSGSVITLTAQALKGSDPASEAIAVPGIRRYQNELEKRQDELKFVKVIAGINSWITIGNQLGIAFPSVGDTNLFLTNINSIDITSSTQVKDMYDIYPTQINTFAANISGKYGNVLSHFSNNPEALATLRDTLPRLWLNGVVDNTADIRGYVKTHINNGGTTYNHITLE